MSARSKRELARCVVAKRLTHKRALFGAKPFTLSPPKGEKPPWGGDKQNPTKAGTNTSVGTTPRGRPTFWGFFYKQTPLFRHNSFFQKQLFLWRRGCKPTKQIVFILLPLPALCLYHTQTNPGRRAFLHLLRMVQHPAHASFFLLVGGQNYHRAHPRPAFVFDIDKNRPARNKSTLFF